MIDSIGNGQIMGDRDDQQDYFANFKYGGVDFFLVADGMGGYDGGALASETVITSFVRHIKQSRLSNIPMVLGQALDIANSDLGALKQKYPNLSEMGTTLVVLAIKGNLAYWLSVGDSSLYQIESNRVTRLNANHSFSESLAYAVKDGIMTAEEAQNNPNSHLITSAICGEPIPMIDCPEQGIQFSDACFLLATDGIDCLTSEEVEKLVSSSKTAQQAVDEILVAVNAKNQPDQDNASVVIVFTRIISATDCRLEFLIALILTVMIFWVNNEFDYAFLLLEYFAEQDSSE